MGEFETTGRTDGNGKMFIYSKAQLDDFFSRHKNHSFVMKIEINPEGTSQALLAYYNSYVVPTFRKGFKSFGYLIQDKETKDMIRDMVASVKPDENLGKIGNTRMIEFLEELKRIAAEEFQVRIEDPKRV